jgi:hypothetical protein
MMVYFLETGSVKALFFLFFFISRCNIYSTTHLVYRLFHSTVM